MSRSDLTYNAVAHILAERYLNFVASTMFADDTARARVISSYRATFGIDIDELSIYSLYSIIRRLDISRGLQQLVFRDEFADQLRLNGELSDEFAHLLGV